MFGIERFVNGTWSRLYTYEGAPVVYDGWATKYAIEFAGELTLTTGLEHRLCVVTNGWTHEERCVAVCIAEGLGEH